MDKILLLLELYREHQTKFVGGKGTIKKHWDYIAKLMQNGKGTIKKHWDYIAKLMQSKGHNITDFKCSTKFQSLKRTYKTVMD